MSRTNHSVRTRERLTAILVLVVIPLTLLAGVQLLSARRWYFIALLIVAWLLLPHFFFFERRRPQAREIVLLAVLTALAVISRAVFFLVPNFKPVLALLVIYGAALGGRTGFLLGALTALVSNFLFGQGPWTLWQMFAWGMIGYTAGILVRHFPALARRWPLAIFGFFAALCIHGGITNPAGVLLFQAEFSWQAVLASYALGLPGDLVLASSTFLFILLLAPSLLTKLTRMRRKYAILPE